MKKYLLMSLLFVALCITSCGKGETDSKDGSSKKSKKSTSAAKLSEAEITDELAKVIGEGDAWQADLLSNLKKDMTGDEVKKIYSDLEIDASKE